MVLAVLVIGLGALAYLQPGRAPEPLPPPLTRLHAGEVTRIEIARRGHPAISLQRSGRHWRITAPQSLPAEDGRIATLLAITETPSESELPAGTKDNLAKYGLAEPTVVLSLNDTRLAFGDTDPINGRRYVLLGDTVHLTEDRYFPLLDVDVAGLVSPKLLPEPGAIARLQLPELTLTRVEGGAWTLQPERKGISEDAIQTLIDSWSETRALWVTKYQAGAAQGEVVVHMMDPKRPTIHFRILARQPELILARVDLGLQYYLPQEATGQLLQLARAAQSTSETAPPAAPEPPAPAPSAH